MNENASVVKGHHIYKAVSMPMISEELPVQSEDDNDHDEHVVAVKMDSRTVRNMLCTISHVLWFFLRHGVASFAESHALPASPGMYWRPDIYFE